MGGARACLWVVLVCGMFSFALIVGVEFVFCYSDIWFCWWFDGAVGLCTWLLRVAVWVCVFMV